MLQLVAFASESLALISYIAGNFSCNFSCGVEILRITCGGFVDCVGISESFTTNHTLMAGPPRLSTFSGESGKGDVSFDQWKLEVKGLIKDLLYSPSVIVQSVRRSLRGTAADVLRTLGEDITAETVI